MARPSIPRSLFDFRPARRVERLGDHACNVAELYLPDGDGPHPVVVVIHGGYWQATWSRFYMRPICRDLARNGWAAWNIEYRRLGKGQGGGWPETFDDVALGVDALADVDAPVDLDRVVGLGHSAGGQLAMWAAARPGLDAGMPGANPRVRLGGVIGLAAVSNLEASASLIAPNGMVNRLLGGSPAEVPDRYVAANPLRRLPLGIPTLLVHGDADATVPPLRSREYAAAATEFDEPVDLIEPEGVAHSAVCFPWREPWEATPRWLASTCGAPGVTV